MNCYFTKISEEGIQEILSFTNSPFKQGKIAENSGLINQIKSKVPNALFPELNSDLACPALVTALSSRLKKGISIDNGVMHMMSLAKVPMIVLFGPTNSDKFAPNHDNTIILDSNKLYKTKDISKIRVEDLLKYID